MPTAAPLATAAVRLAAAAVALILAAASGAAASAAASPAWLLPVRGEVVGAFAYDELRPFAAGQRRGVDLRVRAGAPVRAACSGRVRHAGWVPERGLAVSVRCGPLTATHLGLGALAVASGATVRRGDRLGRAGPSGVVRLGARVTARRFGWVDPLVLLAAPAPPATGPPPLGRAPRGGPRPTASRIPPPIAPRVTVPVAARIPARPAPAAREVPALAWLGAALLAAGLPLGAVVTVRRHRHRAHVAARRAPAS